MSGLSDLSMAARRAMFSSQTDKVILPLIKIWGAEIPTPIRLVRNNEPIFSSVDGSPENFIGFPFNILLPDDTEGGGQTSQLEIDAVDQSIVEAIRPLILPIYLTLWIVLSDSPDIIEAGPVTFGFGAVQTDGHMMVVTLKFEDRLSYKLEGLTFDPVNFPGVH